MKPNGFIIHEGTKNGSKYAVIATLKTSNRKTGNMIQLWILLSDRSPVDGVTSMSDKLQIVFGKHTKRILILNLTFFFMIMSLMDAKYDSEHMEILHLFLFQSLK